jgi:hypothetical protein
MIGDQFSRFEFTVPQFGVLVNLVPHADDLFQMRGSGVVNGALAGEQ